MCNAPALETLILDGFNTAYDCEVYYNDHLPGTIPGCLFTMPTLQIIHLSGIGMKSSLPNVPSISASLKNLSMVYNMITGTIPENIQNKNWDSIELSYNKLTGTLSPNVSSAASGNEVALDNNRLSGELWPSLIDAEHINILQSNMFACPNGVPENDPVAKIYSCGSDVLNFSLAFSFSFTCCVFLAAAIVYFMRAGYDSFRKYIQDLITWYNLSKSDSLQEILEDESSIHFLSVILEKFTLFVLIITLYTIFILLPSYAILSSKSKTFTDQYGWIISGFFFQGRNAAITQFFLFLMLVMLIEYFSHSIVSVDKTWKVNVRDTVRVTNLSPQSIMDLDNEKEREEESEKERETRDSSRATFSANGHGIPWIKKEATGYLIAFIGNCILIGLVNFLFIYIVSKYGEQAVIAANFFLGLFKACYKKWIILAMLKYSKYVAVRLKYYGAPPDEGHKRWIDDLNNNDFFAFSIFQILNNIIIPWVLVLFESQQCFHGRFFEREPVTVNYPI